MVSFPQAAIANARSLDEVQRLEMLLKAGQVPGGNKPNNNVDEEMEDMSNGTWTNSVSDCIIISVTSFFFLSIDYVVSLRKRQQSIETGNIYSSLKDIVECCLVSIAFVGPITEYFMLHLCNHSLQGNIVLSNN